MNHENTIKLICEKRGADAERVFDMYRAIYLQFGFKERADEWLLGFLKSKETLIAVFGEEDTCVDCSESFEKHHRSWQHSFDPAWKYHSDNYRMGYALEEVLKYYEEYLELKE